MALHPLNNLEQALVSPVSPSFEVVQEVIESMSLEGSFVGNESGSSVHPAMGFMYVKQSQTLKNQAQNGVAV